MSHSRTALFWFQYMSMVDILRRFIKAERTGNWQLHFQFTEDTSLRNIATGATAAKSVNVENAREIETTILDKMTGQLVSGYSFKKKDHAVTMSTKSAVKVDGQPIHIDLMLLFQWLVTAEEQGNELASLFKYEISSYPMALFESPQVMLLPNKSQLADAHFSIHVSPSFPGGVVQYVLDGCALLHRLPWKPGQMYAEILTMYVTHVTKKYTQAVVVFDGYSDAPSTKDSAHSRRTAGRCGVTVLAFILFGY